MYHGDTYLYCSTVLCPFPSHTRVSDKVRPGVWFPEEAFDDETKRSRLFDQATRGAFMWEMGEEEARAIVKL